MPVTPNWIEPGARERFVSAVTGTIADRLAAFRPCLLIISAGFDAAFAELPASLWTVFEDPEGVRQGLLKAATERP